MSKKIYELEQEILRCWQITDDLRHIAKASEKGPYLGIHKNLQTIAEYYEFRFGILFESLEATIKEKHKSVGE